MNLIKLFIKQKLKQSLMNKVNALDVMKSIP